MSVIPGVQSEATESSVPAGEEVEQVPEYGVERVDERLLSKEMKLDNWSIDIFMINSASRERPLTVITYAVFKNRGLLEQFKIPDYKLINYLTQLESHYSKDNPYHNGLHAADVVHSTHALLNIPTMKDIYSCLEIFTAIFSAAIHDVDHPGYNNQFLVNTNSELALMYNDESVLENHHLAVAFKLLQSKNSDIFRSLNKSQRQTLRRLSIGIVLGTDISKHMEHVAHLKTMSELRGLSIAFRLQESEEDKHQVLESLVHCADLSNPTKSQPLYDEWTKMIMEEFFRQGDEEKILGLAVSPMCDRSKTNVSLSQLGFIDYIVHPLWETWAELMQPHCREMLEKLEENRSRHREKMNEKK